MEIIRNHSGRVELSMTDKERKALDLELQGRVGALHPMITEAQRLLASLDDPRAGALGTVALT